MPELPDLQVFSKNLTSLLKGKKLKTVALKNKKKSKATEAALKNSLEGSKLVEIFREGKELHFNFGKHILGLHLMLRGQLYFFEGKHDKKFPIVELLFADDTGLVLTDFQGQANAALDPVVRESPDALSKEVTFKFFKDKFVKTKATVKNVLLDQDFIRGIGNAYADEILWDSGISPFSVCNKIPDEKIKALVKSIKSVLTNAEKQILKSHPDIISGEVRDFLAIHNSKKDKSPTGAKIEHQVVGGRKTYFTDEQTLYA
jgi:formamidopyrimidine-DNA glycosylase